ncbi:SLP adapter and CSK-interacting membrane protein isoform X2 [Ascaphus truei]|uniref:SLP adapter and CSK-interacting membrane protein isoform X2 n=1 Tax=Ascaphus truei TaxID=8439 RepID=UPI003F5A9A32
MDSPWYREYFWLLLFGGMTMRIQKSFTVKRAQKLETQGRIIMANSIYRPSAQVPKLPPRIILQNEAEINLSSSGVGHMADKFSALYAIVQKSQERLQHAEIDYENEIQPKDRHYHVSHDYNRLSDTGYIDVIAEDDEANSQANDPAYVDVIEDDDDYDDVVVLPRNYDN